MNWDEWRLARVYREPLQKAGLPAGGRVLDIGGGASEGGPLAGEMGLGYVNLDIAGSGQVDVVGSAEALPFADASFDAAIAAMVFGHIEQPTRALRETVRVLKPGGVGIVVEGNPWSYTLHWLRHRTGLLRGRRMRHYQTYDPWWVTDWRRHLSAAGACDTGIEHRGWVPEALRTYTSGRLQEGLVRGTRAMERIAESTPLLRRAAVWVIITYRKALAS